jgi:hypothetical protein
VRFLWGFHWAAHFELHRIRKLQISNAEIEVLKGPNYGPFSTPNLPGFSNKPINTYATPDYDFERDAAAKLEAFITSKIPAENTSTTSTTWVN